MHLLDTRFAGIALGVGRSKILGTLHYIPVQIGKHFLPCSISVIEDLGEDFILGLDMLKRHQVIESGIILDSYQYKGWSIGN